MNKAYSFLVVILTFTLAQVANGEPFWLKCRITTLQGLESFDSCANGKGDLIKFKPKYFNKIVFNEKKLAGVYVGDSCYWLSSKGLLRKTYCFDNGPDYFVEGYARYLDSRGKFGFIDQKLRVVISPRYDFVFPFELGKAKFCNGCKEIRDPDKEHSVMSGGIWGTVDSKGNQLLEQ